MLKFFLLMMMMLLLSGCSHFRITAAMCDQQDVNNLSGECRDYNEKEAEKSAYPKVETQSKEQFDKEIKEERKNGK